MPEPDAMLSQTTEYALRAMSILATHPDQLVSTVAIAERAHIPANYLAKVLQQLTSQGLLKGRRGVGGGYKLAKEAASITLLDVIRAIGDFKALEHCPLPSPSRDQLCALHKAIDAATRQAIRVFEGTSLQSLVDDTSCKVRPLCGKPA